MNTTKRLIFAFLIGLVVRIIVGELIPSLGFTVKDHLIGISITFPTILLAFWLLGRKRKTTS